MAVKERRCFHLLPVAPIVRGVLVLGESITAIVVVGVALATEEQKVIHHRRAGSLFTLGGLLGKGW